MKKYTGSWSANNGSTYNDGYKSNNLKELKKSMREIAKGNTFQGNSGSWSVRYSDDTENGYPVASGSVRN